MEARTSQWVKFKQQIQLIKFPTDSDEDEVNPEPHDVSWRLALSLPSKRLTGSCPGWNDSILNFPPGVNVREIFFNR